MHCPRVHALVFKLEHRLLCVSCCVHGCRWHPYGTLQAVCGRHTGGLTAASSVRSSYRWGEVPGWRTVSCARINIHAELLTGGDSLRSWMLSDACDQSTCMLHHQVADHGPHHLPAAAPQIFFFLFNAASTTWVVDAKNPVYEYLSWIVLRLPISMYKVGMDAQACFSVRPAS
jgi:hypothetical protein